MKMCDYTADIQNIGNGRKFAVALSTSGIGDQIIGARVAAWLGEIAGFEFAGVLPPPASRSATSGATNESSVLRSIKLDQMQADTSMPLHNVIVPFINDKDDLRRFISESLSDLPADKLLSLITHGAESEHFISRVIAPNDLDMFSTQFDKLWQEAQKFAPDQEEKRSQKGLKSLMIHLRLGDTVNIPLPDGRIMIPNHYLYLGEELGVRDGNATNFDRYDKRKEIFNLIRNSTGLFDEITFHSDGFEFARFLIRHHRAKFETLAPIDYLEKEIDKAEEEMMSVVKDCKHCVGEDPLALSRFVDDVSNSSKIISTSGHFAYNIATAFVRDRTVSVLTEKWGRTSARHPFVKPQYWSGNFPEDINAFISDDI